MVSLFGRNTATFIDLIADPHQHYPNEASNRIKEAGCGKDALAPSTIQSLMTQIKFFIIPNIRTEQQMNGQITFTNYNF